MRPSLDETFFDNAVSWSRRSTCQHLSVGAVLAVDGHQLAAGYNGAPPGLPHCRHDLEDEYTRCTNTNHAEGNVLAFAARYGQATYGSTLYATHSPCRPCAGLLISAGIKVVKYLHIYGTEGLGLAGLEWLEASGVTVEQYERTSEGAWPYVK